MRVIAAAMAALVLTTAGIGPATAATPSTVVVSKKATMLDDGSLRITMRVRCTDRQQGFEWSIDVRQGSVFGNDSAGPVAGLITCDGRFHTVVAFVEGANGSYVPGPATVQALVQLYDADQGSDVQLEDHEVVRVRA